MKLSEYIKKLNEIKKEYGDLELVYAIDSEGNAFHKVSYSPGVGSFDEKDHDFMSDSEFEYYKDEYGTKLKVNAVCIN